MKVIESTDNLLKFDNGLSIIGDSEEDCCEYNYLDFEQIPVGTEFKTMDLEDLQKEMIIKDDGFSIKDKNGISKWVQARSFQNGSYSTMTTLFLEQGDKLIELNELYGALEN